MNLWDVLSTTPEMERLDYVIREHEKLDRRFVALVDLLFEKGLISHDESVRLRTLDPTPDKKR